MFSLVSQISNPSSLFFSLSPSFISSFTPFHHFVVFKTTILFQLNLALSMDSTALLLSLSFHSLPPSPHLQYISSFLFHQFSFIITLSTPFHPVCLMVYPLSLNSLHFILFPLSHFTLFHLFLFPNLNDNSLSFFPSGVFEGLNNLVSLSFYFFPPSLTSLPFSTSLSVTTN